MQLAPPRLNVYLIPALAEPQQMAGGTAVVIDVLRATTTILHGLAAGAKEVIPCLTVDQAREVLPKVWPRIRPVACWAVNGVGSESRGLI